MTNTPPIAATATLLLHAALFAAGAGGLTADPKPEPPREPMQVQLLASAPAPLPVVQPAPRLPLPAPAPPKKERTTPKPRPESRPAPAAGATAPHRASETATETQPHPASPATPSAPAPVVAAPAAPSIPAAPVRTSASEASYAATNRIPPYPRISAINGDEGTVILRVLVTTEGTAGAVEVKTSSGHTTLDESARKTVQTWRFKPATVDGKPVAEWYQVPIPFKLQNN